jgi:hypothetical protein
MTQYWWVNHKQTVRQEIDRQYLWSPKTSNNGARNRFYDNMLPRLGFSEAPMKWRTEAFAPAQCSYLIYHRSQVYVGE